MFTSEVKHFVKLLPGHEDVCVEEGVSAHLAGELLHVSECLHGVKPATRHLATLGIFPDGNHTSSSP